MNSSTSSSKPDTASDTGFSRFYYLLSICAAAALFLLFNQLVLASFGSPKVAENNSQVVILRAQQYEFSEVPAGVLTGSSISGRLNASDFAEAGFPLANMGLDGLSTAFGLDIILEQSVLPELVLVEVNTLDKPVGGNAETINNVRLGFGYDLARTLKFVRAESRPVTVLYDQVRSRRNSGFVVEPASVPISEKIVDSGASEATRQEVIAVESSIRELQQRGVEVVLIVLPTGESEADALRVGADVSSRTQAPLIDLSALGDDPNLYTDGTHLTPIAASKVAHELAVYLSERR